MRAIPVGRSSRSSACRREARRPPSRVRSWTPARATARCCRARATRRRCSAVFARRSESTSPGGDAHAVAARPIFAAPSEACLRRATAVRTARQDVEPAAAGSSGALRNSFGLTSANRCRWRSFPRMRWSANAASARRSTTRMPPARCATFDCWQLHQVRRALRSADEPSRDGHRHRDDARLLRAGSASPAANTRRSSVRSPRRRCPAREESGVKGDEQSSRSSHGRRVTQALHKATFITPLCALAARPLRSHAPWFGRILSAPAFLSLRPLLVEPSPKRWLVRVQRRLRSKRRPFVSRFHVAVAHRRETARMVKRPDGMNAFEFAVLWGCVPRS